MNKHLYLLLFVLLMVGVEVPAQSLRQPIHASYTGMGAYSIHGIDLFSFSANPAVLAQVKQKAFGIYSEQRFLLSALSQNSLVAAFPTSSGSFALQVNYFGSRLYNEIQFGGTYARSLGKSLDLGLGFHYNQLRIPGHLRANAMVVEAGLMMHFNENLHGGFGIYHAVSGNLQRMYHEKIAAVYRGGLGFEASEIFYASVEIIKEANKAAGVMFGLQYKPITQLVLRGGINTIHQQPFFGAGILWSRLRIDITAAHHPQLGISPGIMLLYHFKEGAP